MVLLEAMAARTPVVASDIEGYRTIVSHQVEGLLTPPRDSVTLAEALVFLLQRPDLRQTMGARGQATASQYTWDRVADGVLEYYHDVLEWKRGTDTVRVSQLEPGGVSSYRDGAPLRGKVG
jgi:phosphatidylinositol alpha-mannosyltransferase